MVDDEKKNNNEEYPLLFGDSEEQQEAQLKRRYKHAWESAEKAAILLKEEYGAEKVWVFGSLADEARFNLWSDIDLAAAGIPEDRFYAAVAALTRLITDFKVDLIDINDCKESLQQAVKSEGLEI